MAGSLTVLWVLPVVACASLVMTGVFRRYALAEGLMDMPNARSSHRVPTPRGGGVAIVLCFLATLPLLAAGGIVSWSLVWGLLGGGAGIGLLGYFDDRDHVATRWRLLGHFVGAAWMMFWLGGMPPVSLWGVTVALGWFGHVFAAVYLVWLLNLYNFMDGIDGIASVEAICVCLGGAVLYALLGKPQLGVLPLVLACAVAGFLFWNFPPARIFMGDAGSGFLGIVIGALSIQAAWFAPSLLWSWLILLGVFIVDATYTLLRRMLRGERVYEAHRSHAYQHASRRCRAHLPVTLGVLVIDMGWLLPWACAVALGYVDGGVALLIAYLPLLGLAAYYQAGQPETA